MDLLSVSFWIGFRSNTVKSINAKIYKTFVRGLGGLMNRGLISCCFYSEKYIRKLISGGLQPGVSIRGFVRALIFSGLYPGTYIRGLISGGLQTVPKNWQLLPWKYIKSNILLPFLCVIEQQNFDIKCSCNIILLRSVHKQRQLVERKIWIWSMNPILKIWLGTFFRQFEAEILKKWNGSKHHISQFYHLLSLCFSSLTSCLLIKATAVLYEPSKLYVLFWFLEII